jgi:hypothetical protein
MISGRLVCNGNRETWQKLFARDAIIVWHFRSFKRKRQRIRRWCNDPTAPPVVRFMSSSQTEEWLRGPGERSRDHSPRCAVPSWVVVVLVVVA